MKEIFSIGHSNRTIGEFIGLLRTAGVQGIADVRRFPGSRRNPQFGREALSTSLAEAGLEYRHYEALGGRRGKAVEGSPNTGWRVEAFQAYADRMVGPDWLAALADLETFGEQRPVAIMCAEAVPWRCHRRLIADALLVRGWRVRHILGKRRLDDHALPEFARVQANGGILYPANRETE